MTLNPFAAWNTPISMSFGLFYEDVFLLTLPFLILVLKAISDVT